MENAAILAFITGLTAGGLSCFAVQGGLLSGSIAQRVESDSVSPSKPAKAQSSSRGSKSAGKTAGFQAGMIQPILLFMTAKIIAYTFLGFFLGWLGSLFTFSPMLQGMIQVAIGIFLVGNALRMLDVHPIFRYFSFEPPSSVSRSIRRISKRDDSWITPLYLGAMTILIPCGVTQSMMAVAVGTGSPWMGALIMFAFVLGTAPTFIGVSWIATSLGSMFQRYFYRIVAVIVLVLGLYGVNAGLTLVGSPVSASKIARLFQPEDLVPSASAAIQAEDSRLVEDFSAVPPADASSNSNVVRINVENGGYVPNLVSVPANQPIELHLVTDKTFSCARAFVIPELDVMQVLPETGDTVITIPAQEPGKMMDFMCSMGMYTGVFQFE